jgi:alginate O-acetyltransferase complex protein AlgI
MLFHSLDFLIFYAVVVVLYFLWPRPTLSPGAVRPSDAGWGWRLHGPSVQGLGRYRWALLLAASYVFYASAGPEYLLWIAASTLIGYVVGIQMAKTTVRPIRSGLLAFGIVSNLGLLFAAKYLNFANDSLRAVLSAFNVSYNVPVVKMVLPVGISFYTFQTIGYAIDVHRGKIEPERHLGYYALFVSFFPKLVAGPIERAGHLLPQFRTHRGFDASRVVSGLRLALWGMFKKVVIADRLAVYVDGVYGRPADYTGLPILVAILFFAIQIYCDFSGYSDIAIGVARVMGYDLTPNFMQPYFATSIAEFWRRWHMSLSGWFRDYVYIPLGGNRVPKWRWYVNLMIVFVASGLWHGASWTFVLWGGLHGLYYLVEIWAKRIVDRGAQRRTRVRLHLEIRPVLRNGIAGLVTFVLVCFAWVFFRANSISDAFMLIGNLVRSAPSTPPLASVLAPWESAMGLSAVGSPGLELAFSFALIALLAIVDWGQARTASTTLDTDGIPGWPWMHRFCMTRRVWIRWAVYLALALAVLNLGVRQGTPFVYMQF